ncbi:MAG TPA: hypothetical protein VIK13_12425, partial [Candidatus Limnocylindrales bacterium]
MGFLRRLLGGSSEGGRDSGGSDAGPPDATASAAVVPADEDEIERERELLRAEAVRLDNDLIQRQLRYANRSWTPPAQ